MMSSVRNLGTDDAHVVRVELCHNGNVWAMATYDVVNGMKFKTFTPFLSEGREYELVPRQDRVDVAQFATCTVIINWKTAAGERKRAECELPPLLEPPEPPFQIFQLATRKGLLNG